MVTVKEFLQRESKDGEKFFVLVLQGGATPVKSKKTGVYKGCIAKVCRGERKIAGGYGWRYD